jgi:OHCU decarboxylase
MTLADLNACDRPSFVSAVGWVFEHASWVAERAWPRRPFPSVDALHAAMTEALYAADRPTQLALLRAHPDLGARVKMTDASIGEQAGAGLDRLAGETFERLQALNASYRQRFGFPFILAVKGATAAVVLESLERRLDSTPDDEWREALSQVSRIARFRLDRVLSAA